MIHSLRRNLSLKRLRPVKRINTANSKDRWDKALSTLDGEGRVALC